MAEALSGAMIPKKIHYCWFGPNAPSGLHEACMRTWAPELPGYTVVRWDENNSPMSHPLVAHHYRKKNWAFVSDYVRLYALYREGGIYLDTDVEVIRAFDPLLEARVFFGYEAEDRLNSSVCGARPGEPFIKACMDYMDSRHAEKRPFRIAPEVVSHVYSRGDFTEVATLPQDAFYPYNPFTEGGAGQFLYHDVTERTYAVHHWAKSWRMGLLSRVLRKLV